MIFEVCTDNLETAIMAAKYGCKRVELCSALTVGGLTPSYSLIKACSEQANLETHVMIRHREGNFVISDSDLAIMEFDILTAKKVGVKGIVFGCLTSENELDVEKSRQIVELAKVNGLEVTFHRAFDFITNPFEALDSLIGLGVDRILSSGQEPTAIAGLSLLNDLVEYSNGRIQIMAGSGVNAQNAVELANSGIDALHFTANLYEQNAVALGMGKNNQPDELKIKSIVNLF